MRFFNYPVYFSEEEYKGAVASVAEKCAPFVSSIYSFGGSVTPGISDVDFIIVTDENKKLPIGLRLFLLGKKTRYVFSHPFFFVAERDMENIRQIYPNADFRLIKGKEIGIKEVTKGENRLYELLTSIDLIIRHFPRDYLIPLAKGRINARDMLLRLNSLTISLDAVERAGGTIQPGWGDFKAGVKGIRKEWFAMGKKEREKALLSLVNRAVFVSAGITGEFKQLLKEHVCIGGENAARRVIYRGFQNKAVFVKDWDEKRAISWAKEKGPYALLPLEFAALLAEYAGHNGPISSYIRKNLKGDVYYKVKSDKDRALINKRVDILNNQALLADKLKHSHFSAFIDFGYKSNAGLANKLLNIARKIKYRKI